MACGGRHCMAVNYSLRGLGAGEIGKPDHLVAADNGAVRLARLGKWVVSHRRRASLSPFG